MVLRPGYAGPLYPQSVSAPRVFQEHHAIRNGIGMIVESQRGIVGKQEVMCEDYDQRNTHSTMIWPHRGTHHLLNELILLIDKLCSGVCGNNHMVFI